MVKTELSYNPYIRETIVKFNGLEPKINSQIEKYKNSKLQDWINKLPYIFHDEMNGYNFELHFSGTQNDFERIKNAFKKANVSEKEVLFFYKNELDNPAEKNKKIYELCDWIKSNPNKKFDYAAFTEKYKEFLDAPYSFITINGPAVSSITLSDEKINIENIENVEELTTTDITNIPIVIFIDSHDNIENRKKLQSVICRDDINNKQLFFCIKSGRNKSQIERIISDLGVKEPVLVSGVDDDRIKEYFEVYPLTEYIKSFLDIIRYEASLIQKDLDAENMRSQLANSEVYGKLHRYENDIRLLKEVDNKYLQRDNFIIPEEYSQAFIKFKSKLADWRKNKTKTNSAEEAARLAYELNTEVERFYNEFVDEIDNVSIKKSVEIDVLFSKWFTDTQVEPDYKPDMDLSYEAKSYITPRLNDRFLMLKTERYVDQKNSILDRIKSGNTTEEKKQVIELTYTYESWRNLALEEYNPLCQRVIDDWTTTLSKYYSLLAEVYHKHISELLEEKSKLKSSTADQLSSDEKLKQIDNDWLTELKDRIQYIERG